MAIKRKVHIAEQAAHSLSGFHNDLVAVRREIHADPEVGLYLPRTQARVLEAIRPLGLEVTRGRDCSSIVAVLRGEASNLPTDLRPTVLLRGDMDALPISERSGEPFASVNGSMHACGHDLHVAGLIGAARILTSLRKRLAGDVIFMFQPGEEGHDGAKIMLEEGALSRAGGPVVAAYGIHVAPDVQSGIFTSRPGTYMAAFHELHVKVLGRGGHSSRPFQALDPVQVAAEIIGSIQTYITRRFNVFDSLIFTVGKFNAGTAVNVIPETAEFSASIRSFSSSSEKRIMNDLPDFIRNIVAAHGLSAEVQTILKMPVTVNNENEVSYWMETAAALYGERRLKILSEPKAGSEDFSRVLAEVPGAFGHLGAASSSIDPSAWSPLHSPTAVFDDSVLSDQAIFLAELAIGRL